MSNIINRYRTNSAICEALGLDPSKVHGLTITIQGGEAPVVKITRYIDSTSGDLLAKELRSYDLVPKDQA